MDLLGGGALYCPHYQIILLNLQERLLLKSERH